MSGVQTSLFTKPYFFEGLQVVLDYRSSGKLSAEALELLFEEQDGLLVDEVAAEDGAA